MRFVGVIAVFLVFFGLVGATQSLLRTGTHQVAAHDGHGGASRERAGGTAGSGRYRLRLTPTFDAERDPFALRDGGGQAPLRLLVRTGDRVLHSRTEDWQRGEQVVLEGVELDGAQAELFVMATPSETEMQKAVGVRVEVFREDGVLCDERTLWTEAGAVLSKVAVFSLRPASGLADAASGKDSHHE